MRKKMVFGTLGLAVVLGSSFFLKYMDGKAPESNKEKTKPKTIEVKPSSYVVSSEESQKATKEIGKIENEDLQCAKMLGMAIQKVNFGNEKYTPRGVNPDSIKRIKMTRENLVYFQKQLKSIETDNKKTYEIILHNWIEGNFKDLPNELETIVINLNKENEYKGDKITMKTESEEQDYISHFFGKI